MITIFPRILSMAQPIVESQLVTETKIPVSGCLMTVEPTTTIEDRENHQDLWPNVALFGGAALVLAMLGIVLHGHRIYKRDKPVILELLSDGREMRAAEVAKRSNGRIDPLNVHSTLARMQDEGLVECRLVNLEEIMKDVKNISKSGGGRPLRPYLLYRLAKK